MWDQGWLDGGRRDSFVYQVTAPIQVVSSFRRHFRNRDDGDRLDADHRGRRATVGDVPLRHGPPVRRAGTRDLLEPL